MHKHRREIPFSAFLAARAACRALAEAESGSAAAVRREDADEKRRVAAREADDDVVVMTIN